MSTSTSDRPILDWQINTSYSQSQIFDALGQLPTYILADDPRPAMDQIAERSQSGWTTIENTERQHWRLYNDYELACNGMPPMVPAAKASHRGELILAYPARFVCIEHSNNSFSLARIV